MSRIADASTMLRTRKRLTALSFGTSTPEASQRTRRTWPRAPGGLFPPGISTLLRHGCNAGQPDREGPCVSVACVRV